MITSPTQALELNKASIDVLAALAASAFQAAEKLAQLNLAASRTMLQDSTAAAQTLLAIKDPKEVATVAQSWVGPNAEKVTGYAQTAYDIASEANANVAAIVDTQVAEGKRKIAEYLELAAKNAPAGSEAVLALFRNAVTAANTSLDALNAASRQGNELARAGTAAAVSAVNQAVRKVA